MKMTLDRTASLSAALQPTNRPALTAAAVGLDQQPRLDELTDVDRTAFT
jgi:hypothetical protein